MYNDINDYNMKTCYLALQSEITGVRGWPGSPQILPCCQHNNRIDITFQVVIVCSDIMLCTHLTSHFNCQHHCGASSASSFEWKQMILFRIFETLTQSINIDLCCVYSVKPIDWLEMPGRVKFMLHDDVLKQKARPSASRLTSTSTEWDSQLNFDVSSGWLN